MTMPHYMEIMGVIYGNNGSLDSNPFEKCSSQEGNEFGAPKGSFVNQGGNNQTLIFLRDLLDSNTEMFRGMASCSCKLSKFHNTSQKKNTSHFAA